MSDERKGNRFGDHGQSDGEPAEYIRFNFLRGIHVNLPERKRGMRFLELQNTRFRAGKVSKFGAESEPQLSGADSFFARSADIPVRQALDHRCRRGHSCGPPSPRGRQLPIDSREETSALRRACAKNHFAFSAPFVVASDLK